MNMNVFKRNVIYYSLIIALSLFFSCKPKTIFEKNEIIPEKSWDINNTYSFTFNIEKGNKTYDILIPIVYSKDIDFNNLNISFHLNSENEDRYLYREIALKNENLTPIGKQREDGLYKIEYFYMKAMKIKRKGKYTLSIKNNMSLISTIGIAEIGLIVKESK